MTVKDSSNPTDQEIQQAIEMIRKVKAHLGITDVSVKDSVSSSLHTSPTMGFSDEIIGCNGSTWNDVLDACFAWDDGVVGITLNSGEYRMVSEVRIA